MSPRSSHILIWTCVALLTLGLHAAALLWIALPKHPEPKQPAPPTRLDLSILQPAPPTPDPVAEPTPEPEPVQEPTPEPEPTPPPPPKIEPPVKPEPPKPDPAILKRQQEKAAAEQRERDLKAARDRALAKKRMDEKRAREKAARAAQAKRDAVAAAARKRAAEARRIATKPSTISRRKPSYPRSAIRAGHQGTTVLSITVGTNGRVTSVRISKSSGHTTLDNAAVSAARSWRFHPAKNGLGQPVPYTLSAPIPFKLQ
ncbi:MAG: energy transducer TonB [Verrucomicrobiaceae bacterium]